MGCCQSTPEEIRILNENSIQSYYYTYDDTISRITNPWNFQTRTLKYETIDEDDNQQILEGIVKETIRKSIDIGQSFGFSDQDHSHRDEIYSNKLKNIHFDYHNKVFSLPYPGINDEELSTNALTEEEIYNIKNISKQLTYSLKSMHVTSKERIIAYLSES